MSPQKISVKNLTNFNLSKLLILQVIQRVKSVQIRSFFRSVFSCIHSVFSCNLLIQSELNKEIYGVNLRIQSEDRKIRTRKNSLFGYFSHSGIFSICDKRTLVVIITECKTVWGHLEILFSSSDILNVFLHEKARCNSALNEILKKVSGQ